MMSSGQGRRPDRLRAVLSVAFCAIIVSIAGQAAGDTEGFRFGGAVIMDGAVNGVRSGTLNQNNALDMSRREGATRTLFDVGLNGVNVRWTATGQWSSTNEPRYRGRLLSAQKEWWVDDQTKLLVGKSPLNWDTAYAGRPVGFFATVPDRSDFNDRRAQIVGTPMAALTRIGGDWEVDAVVAGGDDAADLDQTERGQWALRYQQMLGETTVSAIVQQSIGLRPGLGGALSTVQGAGFEFHASGFVRQGTARPIHRSILANDFAIYQDDPVLSLRERDSAWYPRWTIGVNWTSENLTNFIVEWIHDERGINRRQWNHFTALNSFYAGNLPGVPRSALNGNLGFSGRTLLTSGTRRDYAFVRAEHHFGDWTATIASLTGLADRSASFDFDLAYKGFPGWEIWNNIRFNAGPPNSEFATVPQRNVILFGVRRNY